MSEAHVRRCMRWLHEVDKELKFLGSTGREMSYDDLQCYYIELTEKVLKVRRILFKYAGMSLYEYNYLAQFPYIMQYLYGGGFEARNVPEHLAVRRERARAWDEWMAEDEEDEEEDDEKK